MSCLCSFRIAPELRAIRARSRQWSWMAERRFHSGNGRELSRHGRWAVGLGCADFPVAIRFGAPTSGCPTTRLLLGNATLQACRVALPRSVRL
jgi:hypothetical protein